MTFQRGVALAITISLFGAAVMRGQAETLSVYNGGGQATAASETTTTTSTTTITAGGGDETPLTGNVAQFAAASNYSPAAAQNVTKHVEIATQSYIKEAELSNAIATADSVYALINSDPALPVQMEALRRASIQLSDAEQRKLLQLLYKRYRSKDGDPRRYFAHGYAQVLIDRNDVGLYFLRKASDALANQFATLAYAITQADVDLNIDKASARENSLRKIDVQNRLIDAVNRDSANGNHLEGFWPSYVHLLGVLSHVPAYHDFVTQDWSRRYVPFGRTGVMLPVRDAMQHAPDKKVPITLSAACEPNTELTSQQPAWGQLKYARSVDLTGNNNAKMRHTLLFFGSTDDTRLQQLYNVMVLGPENQAIGMMTSPNAPYIVEDIDDNGSYELVIRQYQQAPLEPVRVYEVGPCGIKKQETIARLFQ